MLDQMNWQVAAATNTVHPMLDPDNPQFFSYQATSAAKLPQQTTQNWLARKAIVLADEYQGPGHGRARLWTLRQIYQLAITAELFRRGVAPAQGSLLACHFTDWGDETRSPGELFAEDETLLVVYGPADKPEAQVMPLSDFDIGKLVDNRDASLVVVNVSRLVREVRHTLDLPV